MMWPGDPLAAVTHPNPYPYYADLVATRPLFRDEALGLWVASSADAVGAVLISDVCRVRPAAEPVPSALLGSPAADVFRYLVRMNDGRDHLAFKRAISGALASVDLLQVDSLSRTWARLLMEQMRPVDNPARLLDFAFDLPVYVVGSLLGLTRDTLQRVALWMGDFVHCLAPTSSPGQVERGKVAAGHLLATYHSHLAAQRTRPTNNLLGALAWQAARLQCEDADSVVVANGIGLLSQAYEATAGLIGNTLVALAFHRETLEQVRADPAALGDVVREVLRHDPPIQNTRRFVSGSAILAGRQMEAGERILVVLAAANRDPSANPDPDRFDRLRRNRKSFTFGVGAHACPSEALATTIARGGLEALLLAGIDPEELTGRVTYRPSLNARVPLLGQQLET